MVGVVAGVPRFVVGILGVQHIEVLGVLGVGGPCDDRVAVEQRTRVERGEQPLVGIDDEAVGAFDPLEAVAHARRRERGAPVGAVDVEPRVDGGGGVGGAGEVVDHADVGRSRGGDDGEHAVTVVAEAGDHLTKRIGPHLTALAGGNHHDVGVHRAGGLGDRRVRARRRDHQPACPVVGPVGAVAPPPAGGDQGAEVAGGAAADEHAACFGGSPTRSAIHRSASFSAWIAPAPSSHDPA
jgi:hypothetical protein